MERQFKNLIKARVEKAKNDLINNVDNIKDNLDDIMRQQNICGMEIMRDPFLWRDGCKQVILNIDNQLRDIGYFLCMNFKDYSVIILQSNKISCNVKKCLLGWEENRQFINCIYPIKELQQIS